MGKRLIKYDIKEKGFYVAILKLVMTKQKRFIIIKVTPCEFWIHNLTLCPTIEGEEMLFKLEPIGEIRWYAYQKLL